MIWPDEVKQQLGGRDPRVGDWYSFNAEDGLFEINSQDELDQIFESVEGFMDIGTEFGRFFENEATGLAYFKEHK